MLGGSCRSGAEGGEGTVGEEFDDAAGASRGMMECRMVGETAVDALHQQGTDIVVTDGGGLPREVGRGADNGFSQLL